MAQELHIRGLRHRHVEGDSYLASLSDLMVGLLFVFIIMLMAFALNYRTATESSAKQEKKYQQQISEEERIRQNMEEALSRLTSQNKGALAEMLHKIQQQLHTSGIEVSVSADQSTLRIGEDTLNFTSGSWNISPAGDQVLQTIAQVLMHIVPCYAHGAPDCGKIRPILEAAFIEGSTDNVPYHNGAMDNWNLSANRAVEAYRHLITAQPGLDELRNTDNKPLFGVSGYADRRPVAENDTDDDRKRNRRIDVRFLLLAPTQQDLDRTLLEIGAERQPSSPP